MNGAAGLIGVKSLALEFGRNGLDLIVLDGDAEVVHLGLFAFEEGEEIRPQSEEAVARRFAQHVHPEMLLVEIPRARDVRHVERQVIKSQPLKRRSGRCRGRARRRSQ